MERDNCTFGITQIKFFYVLNMYGVNKILIVIGSFESYIFLNISESGNDIASRILILRLVWFYILHLRLDAFYFCIMIMIRDYDSHFHGQCFLDLPLRKVNDLFRYFLYILYCCNVIMMLKFRRSSLFFSYRFLDIFYQKLRFYYGKRSWNE
jgi:hypothetical protein